MKFLDFRKHFEPFRVFNVGDIQKWDAGFDTRRLVEWQDKNYIHRVVNRWYVFNETSRDEHFLYLVANRIYAPSYVSFESALSYYQLIPEGVYMITSATSLKTNRSNTPIGNFNYRHLKPGLMFGYQLIDAGGFRYKVARPEKLMLDYLYLNPRLQSAGDFESLRLNLVVLRRLIHLQRLEEYLSMFENKSLEKRTRVLLNLLRNA